MSKEMVEEIFNRRKDNNNPMNNTPYLGGSGFKKIRILNYSSFVMTFMCVRIL